MLKKYLPLLFLLLAFNFSAKAQTLFPNMDVQHYTFNLTLNDANDVIKGKAAITIKLLKNVKQVELNLVKKNDGGKGMEVSSITENGKSLKFSQDEDVLHITTSAQNNSIHTYTINYSGVPADGLIISTNKFGHRTFFGDNWPDRAHNWLPCADYLSDKATVDFVVTAPDHYKVVSNGLKIEEKELPGHTKLTHWKEGARLAPDVMVIGVADFAIGQSGTVKGIPVYSYVFPENKESGFKSYAYAPAVLSYYYNKIGPYAFEKLANVQSKTIYGGMENSGAIFYFEDSPGDAGAESLIAHEVAHQWFGDNVTEKTWKDLWLSEGFATYMTNCYLENKYGADTLKQRMAFDRQKVINFEKERFTPVIDSNVTDDYKQLLNANSYEKGSWTLHMLRRKLGDTLFWKGLRIYYAKKGGGNASTADLETTMEQTSGQNLHRFFHQWLKIAGTPRLSISWNYDADKKLINIHITQKQEYLYDLPVQYAIGNKIYTVEIRDKETVLSLPAAVKPTGVKMDPNVNLLASFEVVEL